jgi:lipopolysaccharide transport system ATP-binding protein
LGKRYRLRRQGSGHTGLRHLLQDALINPWRQLQGGRPSRLPVGTRATQEDFWALQDISFEVKRGTAMGIIGRNGAGKSTLLKILSRITEPTSGRLEVDGRVASLLEVGTGFHFELTGRENIYLNGAILGMQRREINRKFNEIVAFAEVEKFLDVPVKHYSSGMYVRLAFAVAAHLEPEILVVDEVLAVGDAQFQSKCLGKMEDASRQEGRTILFVSHNMAAILQLTTQCIVLGRGKVIFQGPTEEAVQIYNESCGPGTAVFHDVENAPRKHVGTLDAKIVSLSLDHPSPVFAFAEDFRFSVAFKVEREVSVLCIHLTIHDAGGIPVGSCFSPLQTGLRIGESRKLGLSLSDVQLAPGHYSCDVTLTRGDNRTGFYTLDIVSDNLPFEVLPEQGRDGTVASWHRGWGSVAFPTLKVF